MALGTNGSSRPTPKVTEVAEVLGCSILGVNGARVAVPQGALRLGPGQLEFWVIVDDVLDLVESTVIAGRIGDVRVDVTLSAFADTRREGTVYAFMPNDGLT